MNAITIPDTLKSSFGVAEPSRVYDEKGNLLGYYTPVREATEEDYKWAMEAVTEEEIEQSLKSGPCRPFADVIADLKRRYGP